MTDPVESRPTPLRSPPPGATIVARALNILAFTLAPLLLVPLAHNWLRGSPVAVALIAVQLLAIAVALWLNRTGHTRAGGLVFTSGGWLLTFGLAAFVGEGMRDVALFALAPILLAAGLLAGRRFLWALTGVTLAALTLLWLAERHAWISPRLAQPTHITVVIDAAVILLMTAAATSVIITDLRRTLEAESRNAAALERSELRFRTAIELAADGILLADADGRVNEANMQAGRLLGLKRREIAGSSLFGLITSADCPPDTELRQKLDRGEIVTCERTLQAGSATATIVETIWQRLPDRSIQCFLRDISARRRLEEQLRRAQKMEAVGTLAGGIAHDFSNLIAVMRGFLDLVEADHPLSGAMAGHLAELRTASARAAGLTQQLLAFADRKPLERRITDLRDLIAADQRLVARLAGDSIKVVAEPLTTPCPVLLDPALFTQVLLDLAANARDAMPEGGRITISAIPPAARTPPGPGPGEFIVRDYTGIRFSDTGVGMSPETAARIFEPFFTTKRIGRNAGLGLSMVHGIVERHAGWVEVESAAGRGATFSLFLPVYSPPGHTEGDGAPPAAAGRHQGTVLVVDDDSGMRRLAAHVLAQAGFQVLQAGTGPEALAAWDEHAGPVDLVFTDMVMPGGMNGMQLIHECRARIADMPAILTSGYTLPPPGHSAASVGAVSMLAKPYANTVLIDTVRSLLAAHRRASAA